MDKSARRELSEPVNADLSFSMSLKFHFMADVFWDNNYIFFKFILTWPIPFLGAIAALTVTMSVGQCV